MVGRFSVRWLLVLERKPNKNDNSENNVKKIQSVMSDGIFRRNVGKQS